MKLATWNLEHFWPLADSPLLIRKNGQATRLRSTRLLDQMRGAIQSLDADILCLQEIGGLSALSFLCPSMQGLVEARLNPAAAPHARRHGVALAFSDRLSLHPLPEIDLRTVEGADDYARNALAVVVNDAFIVVGLHLKSGCRYKLRLDKRAPCKILNQQIDRLCQWMADQSLPLVLMGDFNRILAQPRDPILKRLLMAHSDMRLAPTTGGQIDHIFTPKSWRIQTAGIKNISHLSDHRPVHICAHIA